MYTITKQFEFSASHQLSSLPESHPCSRLHGHNYVVTLELRSQHLDDYGFVVDYGDLRVFKKYIDDEFDHRHLNEVMSTEPTAEILARYFYEWTKSVWPAISAVTVSETAKTTARYSE